MVAGSVAHGTRLSQKSDAVNRGKMRRPYLPITELGGTITGYAKPGGLPIGTNPTHSTEENPLGDHERGEREGGGDPSRTRFVYVLDYFISKYSNDWQGSYRQHSGVQAPCGSSGFLHTYYTFASDSEFMGGMVQKRAPPPPRRGPRAPGGARSWRDRRTRVRGTGVRH